MDNCFWRRVARGALVFFAGLGLGVSPGATEIYKSFDEQGRVQFSDKAPQRGGADGAEKIALEPDINTYQGVEVSVSDFLQTVQQAQEDAANNKKQPVVRTMLVSGPVACQLFLSASSVWTVLARIDSGNFIHIKRD